MERIEGLKDMDCTELCAALDAVKESAAEEAEALREEINKSYAEKDNVEKDMHKASEKKDLKAYKDKRLHFDMLIEYIAKCEQRLYALEEGALIFPEDAGEIKKRMNDECYHIIGKAAVEIEDLLKQADAIRAAVSKMISARNAVLLELHTCQRPKSEYGEELPPSGFYRDQIIAPYLDALKSFQDNRIANFRVFANGYRRTGEEKPIQEPDYIPKPGEPITKIWNGKRWQIVPPAVHPTAERIQIEY